MKKLATLALCALTITACAAYRTNSDIDFSSTNIANQATIPVGIDVGERKYEELGEVKAVIKKATAFHSNPTHEQANVVLAYEGQKLGADAVINVIYDTGIAFDSWGKMEAIGTAIKFAQ